MVAKLVENLPEAEFKVLTRDLNLDLMERYSVDGKKRIPTVVFFNSDFKEFGLWIEKPSNFLELQEKFKDEPGGKEKYLEVLKEEVIKEILEILKPLTLVNKNAS